MLELATATDGLVLVREVGGEHLRSAGHLRWVASYDSEPLLPRRDECDHFIGHSAVCCKGGDHVRCACCRMTAGNSYSFRLGL